jgi:hypothetical protein
MMYGEKENPYPGIDREVLEDWPWAQEVYTVMVDAPKDQILAVLIDPSQLMADIAPENNGWQAE